MLYFGKYPFIGKTTTPEKIVGTPSEPITREYIGLEPLSSSVEVNNPSNENPVLQPTVENIATLLRVVHRVTLVKRFPL